MRHFQNILLVFNGSDLSDAAAQRALKLAKTNLARLTVIDVINSSPINRGLQAFSEKIEHIHERICEDRREEIALLLEEYSQKLDVNIQVCSGKPFLEIIKHVLQHECDLVIKSVEKESRLSSMLFGSTDLHLLRKCPCQVWLVKPDDHEHSRKILAAVDLESFDGIATLDQLNQQIVEMATSLATEQSSELIIVNAWVVFGEEMLQKKMAKLYADDVASWMTEQQKNIEEAQSRFLQLLKDYLVEQGLEHLNYRCHFVEGEAVDVILDLAEKEEVDLVVMGTVARTDLAGFFIGNTSEAILSQINCSVLAVKPSGFISPVKRDNQ